MADSAFLAAAVDFATIITDDADSNDTDVNNETFIGDLFSNDSFDDFDFNETTKNTTATTFGFLDNLVIFLNSECVGPLSNPETSLSTSPSANSTIFDDENDSSTLLVLPQDALFYIANVFFLAAYLSPNSRYGQVFLHAGLVVGFLILSTWAWNVVCAPDVFAWYFSFMLLNVGQLLYILYQMRPIQFDPDLEKIYESLFFPMGVSRIQFKRLLGGATSGGASTHASAHHHLPGEGFSAAQIVTFHAGECYAIQNMTKTDRLALLISGRVNVINDRSFLHHIEPGEFLDSPEFESSGPHVGQTSSPYNFSGLASTMGDDTTFNVTVCSAITSRCVVWKRANLEYMFVKDPHLATAMTTLISRDITLKLYSMNAKLRRTVDGANLDIRLPGIAGRLSEMDTRQLAKFNAIQKSEENKSVQEKALLFKSKKSGKKDNRTIEFAPPLLIPIQKKKKSK